MTSTSIPTHFRLEPASWQHDRTALLAVRETVFVHEQGVPADEEVDSLDDGAWHVLARDLHDKPIGAGRLTSEPRIGRMAVLPSWRGQGVGRTILQALLDQARSRAYPKVSLHAQLTARDFYVAAGFEPVGEQFDECGIMHQRMELALSAPSARPEQPLRTRAIEHIIEADGPDQLRAASSGLLEAARHQICLFSPGLDAPVFAGTAAMQQLRRIACNGPHARLRFIIQDIDQAVAAAGPLISLAQKLPSNMQIRVAVEDVDRLRQEAFLLNDVQGYLYRPQAAYPLARGSSHAPGRHRQLQRLFDEMWERAHDSPRLRALSI